MFGTRFRVFTLAGFKVYIDLSWFIVAMLVTWSLAEGVFRDPRMYPGLEQQAAVRWAMGVAGALLFFLSIVLHEFGHAITARRFGLHIRGITLFIFGGVAELSDEPPNAKAEFWVAIAGPAVSVALGLLFLGLSMLTLPLPAQAVAGYLGMINLLLVAFNMIPAFPLDGGRILRAGLWAARDNLRWATRITSRIGEFCGMGFILLGVFVVFYTRNVLGGVWWVLIGLFLRQAAQMSYQQLLLRRALEGEPVSRFMKTQPITVPPDITIADLVENYIYTHHHKMYPVATNGHLLGCIGTREVKNLPREQWGVRTVGEVIGGCSQENTISPSADAMEALAKMNRTGASRLLVVDDSGELVGIVTLKDLMRFMSLKVEMDG